VAYLALVLGRMGRVMKNTGKRIFAVLVVAVVSSLPLLAMAGQFWSQR